MTTKPEEGPHYFTLGYYFSSEEAAEALIRALKEGWTLVATLPEFVGTIKLVFLISHPTEKAPSWEQ